MSDALDRIGRSVVESVDEHGYRSSGFYGMTRVQKRRCPVCWSLDENGHAEDCELAAYLEDGG